MKGYSRGLPPLPREDRVQPDRLATEEWRPNVPAGIAQFPPPKSGVHSLQQTQHRSAFRHRCC